jgi:integrase
MTLLLPATTDSNAPFSQTVTSSRLLALVAQSDRAERTKQIYTAVLDHALQQGTNLLQAEQLTTYATSRTPAQRVQLRAAITLVTKQLILEAQSMATPENLPYVQAAILRLQALPSAIKVSATKGRKTHKWLSQTEFESLLGRCDTRSLRGQRDQLALLLMGDCGLRRNEAVGVRHTDLIYQGGNPVLRVVGKGARERSVEVHPVTVRLMQVFAPGYVLRAIDRHGNVQARLSGRAMTDIVAQYGRLGGWLGLAPHDLRRTAAQIRRTAGWPLEAVQQFLGHEHIETTRNYLEVQAHGRVPVSLTIPT